MSSVDDLDALAWEANRRGISYGELVAHLKPGELWRIRNEYREHKNEKRLAAAERASAKAKPAKRRRRKKEEV